MRKQESKTSKGIIQIETTSDDIIIAILDASGKIVATENATSYQNSQEESIAKAVQKALGATAKLALKSGIKQVGIHLKGRRPHWDNGTNFTELQTAGLDVVSVEFIDKKW